MALTVEQQKKLIEAEQALDDYLKKNPHMMPFQAKLNTKLEAVRTPEQTLK